MTSPPKTLVGLATYNEIDNLPSLVVEVERELPEADVLVVDDSSPDGTGRWCDERARRDARFRVLHRDRKRGLGTATRRAMQHAIDAGYDRLITMDADFSHPPRYLPVLQEAAVDADLAFKTSNKPPQAILEGFIFALCAEP